MVAQALPVQTAYVRYINAAQAGMPATTSGFDVDTKIVQGASIPFGVAVCQGTFDRACNLGIQGGRQLIGISCQDVTLPAVDGPDIYVQGDNAGIAVRGDWWVPILAGDSPGVIPGDAVYANNTTGLLGTLGGGGTTKIQNARWMTSVVNGVNLQTGYGQSFAVVRLGTASGNAE
jgi:hypothetical protein